MTKILDILDERGMDRKGLNAPPALLMALLQDVGQIPLLKEKYNIETKGDHVYAGANLFKVLFRSVVPEWEEAILHAVINHHGSAERQVWTEILCDAEKRARERELQVCEIWPESYEKWFSAEEFIEMLKPKVNFVFNGKNQLFTWSRHGVLLPGCGV